MDKDSRLYIALRYLVSYAIACAIGFIAYVILSQNWGAIIFCWLVPVVFPHGIAIVFWCYDVNPSDFQMVLAFGPYIAFVVAGIATKWRLFYILFVALLLINIGGCVIAGVEEIDMKRGTSSKQIQTIVAYAPKSDS